MSRRGEVDPAAVEREVNVLTVEVVVVTDYSKKKEGSRWWLRIVVVVV